MTNITERPNTGLSLAVQYKAALYCRLSRDDNNGNSESISIHSQRDLLVAYATEKGYEIADIYIDDGYTGTNFDRPNFQRMIEDIKLGKINMVITKDLSRLGRNYIVTGQYTDYFFPDNNVRYIAVTDDYDTQKEDNDIAPFKNILNEMYARDISKKVRAARKVAASQGKFMGSIPSYGYKRSETDRHKLVIDEEAAQIVRQIFELYKNHNSRRSIAEILNSKGILTPQNYYYTSQGKENPYKRNKKTWCSNTIATILKNEVYLGHVIQSKRTVKSFKTKKVELLPPEMWHIAENQHEPIIDMDTWNAVQLLLKANFYSSPSKTLDADVSLFSNLVYCKDCKSRLTFNSNRKKTFIDQFYRCSAYIQRGKESCKPHRITLDVLSHAVLEDIKIKARLAKADEEAFIKELYQVSLQDKKQRVTEVKAHETEVKNRMNDIDHMIQSVFEKNVKGEISDKIFNGLIAKYEMEKLALEEEAETLKLELMDSRSEAKDIQKDLEELKKYAKITELNRKIVTNLIHSIHISEPKQVDGMKTYDIEIKYNFQKV